MLRFGVHTLKPSSARWPSWKCGIHIFATVVLLYMQHKESTLGKLQEIREFLDSFSMAGIPLKYHWSCAAHWRLT